MHGIHLAENPRAGAEPGPLRCTPSSFALSSSSIYWAAGDQSFIMYIQALHSVDMKNLGHNIYLIVLDQHILVPKIRVFVQSLFTIRWTGRQTNIVQCFILCKLHDFPLQFGIYCKHKNRAIKYRVQKIFLHNFLGVFVFN